MAREVKLTPVAQPTGQREVTLTPVEAGITRGAGAEAGVPLDPTTFKGRFFEDLMRNIGGTVEAVVNPIETIKGLGNIGAGMAIQALQAEGPFGPALTSKVGSLLERGLPEALPTARAAETAIAEEVGRIATDPLGALSERPVSTALNVGAVAAPTLRATGLGALNLPGRAISKPRRVVGKAVERKTTNVTRRLAGDLGISPQSVDVVRRNSPDFQSAVTGQADDLVLLQRAQEASQGARNALNAEFRGRLEALGIDDPVDLRIARARIDKRLEDFGLKRAPDGELKAGKLGGGLTSGEQLKLREWVESNLDDQIAQNPVITLDDAERFRQERVRNTKPIMETKAGDKAVESIVMRYNESIDVQKPGFKAIAKDFAPRFDRLEKNLQELGISGRGKEGTKINTLLQAAKKGEDTKTKALSQIEELSGVNMSDMLVGRQIARTLDKPTRTARDLRGKLTQFISEFGETPADVAQALASPTLAARAKTKGGQFLEKLARVAQKDPEALTETSILNILRGATRTQEEREKQ